MGTVVLGATEGKTDTSGDIASLGVMVSTVPWTGVGLTNVPCVVVLRLPSKTISNSTTTTITIAYAVFLDITAYYLSQVKKQ